MASETFADELRAAVAGDKRTLYTELMLQAAELLDEKNASPAPAATDTGLETVAWQDFVPSTGWVASSPSSIAKDKRELVTRPQAEELLAAKDKQMALAETSMLEMHQELNKLEADNAALIHDLNRIKDHETELVNDNAALTARVKELEAERYKLAYAITGGEDAPGYLDSLCVETLVEVARDNTRRWFAETDRAQALEAKLAAAEKSGVRHD